MREYDISMACSMRRRKCLLGKPEGKGPLGRSRHRCGIILKWILKIGWAGPGMVNSDSGEGMSGCFCAHGSGIWFCPKCRNFVELLRIHWLLEGPCCVELG